MSDRKAEWFIWGVLGRGATDTYGVSYRVPGEEHTMCAGLYKWQAEWLVATLNKTGEYPTPPREIA